MIKIISVLVFVFIVPFMFIGCGFHTEVPKAPKASKPKVIEKVIVQKVDQKDIVKAIKTEKSKIYKSFPVKEFVVYGEGIAPSNTISPAQAIALAKRAAVADAYRQLGEKLYGVRVNSKETVKDAALKDSRIVTQVNGLIKNAIITDTSYKDGLYRVRMELVMSTDKWKDIFSY